jgi:hypothetical protein
MALNPCSRPRPRPQRRAAPARHRRGGGDEDRIEDVEDVYLREDGSIQCVV